MDTVRVVLERGVELLLAGGTWRAPNAPSVSYSSLQDAPNAMSPLRVVSVTKRINNGDDRKFLLRSDSNRIYAIHVSDLINRPFTAHLIFPAHQLAYLVGGVAYHCERIADLYAEIGVQFSKFLQIDPDFGRSGIANLQSSRSLTMNSTRSLGLRSDPMTAPAICFGTSSAKEAPFPDRWRHC